MANTYSSLFYHIVFSTKNRAAFIRPEIENRVWAYVGGIARTHKMTAIQIGGVEDHVHVLCNLTRKLAPMNLLEILKKDSSKFVKTLGPQLGAFHWQDGYGGFSVGRSGLPTVRNYIASQKEHHRRASYEEEFIALLEESGITYDERYLWD